MDKKNFSFYMPEDFDDKLQGIASRDSTIAALSKSQALYYIISKVDSHKLDIDKLDAEMEKMSDSQQS